MGGVGDPKKIGDGSAFTPDKQVASNPPSGNLGVRPVVELRPNSRTSLSGSLGSSSIDQSQPSSGSYRVSVGRASLEESPHSFVPIKDRSRNLIPALIVLLTLAAATALVFSAIGFAGANNSPVHPFIGTVGHALGNTYSGVLMAGFVVCLLGTVCLYRYNSMRSGIARESTP